jgi:hypothetical protein
MWLQHYSRQRQETESQPIQLQKRYWFQKLFRLNQPDMSKQYRQEMWLQNHQHQLHKTVIQTMRLPLLEFRQRVLQDLIGMSM